MAGNRRKPTALTFNVGGEADRQQTRLVIGRGLFFVLALVFALLIFLSAVTIYNFFEGPTVRSSGNDLAFKGSSSVREQQLTRIIELNQDKINQLQDENNRRKQDVSDLETRVQELNKSIDALKQLARDIDSKVPAPPGGPAPATPGSGG